MGWISLQRQRGLNMAQGGKTGSGEERRGFRIWFFFFSFLLTSVTTSCVWLPSYIPQSCPRLGEQQGLTVCVQLRIQGQGCQSQPWGSWMLWDSLWLPSRMPGGAAAGFALETAYQFILDFRHCGWREDRVRVRKYLPKKLPIRK